MDKSWLREKRKMVYLNVLRSTENSRYIVLCRRSHYYQWKMKCRLIVRSTQHTSELSLTNNVWHVTLILTCNLTCNWINIMLAALFISSVRYTYCKSIRDRRILKWEIGGLKGIFDWGCLCRRLHRPCCCCCCRCCRSYCSRTCCCCSNNVALSTAFSEW